MERTLGNLQERTNTLLSKMQRPEQKPEKQVKRQLKGYLKEVLKWQLKMQVEVVTLLSWSTQK